MAAIYSKTASGAYREFKEELNFLLNRTITQAPLVLLETPDAALLQFRRAGAPYCVHVGGRFHLSILQTITAASEPPHGFKVRTLNYAYRITEGERRDSPYILRWEYISREDTPVPYPRHHLHIPCRYKPHNMEALHFGRLHVPTGWVTIEEVIRFLIQELHVTPLSQNWDAILRESEQSFRERTARRGSAS